MGVLVTQSAAALLAVLLLSASGAASASRQLTAPGLAGVGAASDVQAAAAPLVSFTPAPITGIALAADQALGSTPAPIVLPASPAPAPDVTRVVSDPAPVANEAAPVTAAVPSGPWACGVADAVCNATGTLATVGAETTFAVTVAAGEASDMIVVVNSTSGDVDL